MLNLRKKYRNLKRAREILAVLARFGLSYFLDLPAIEKYLNLSRKFFRTEAIETKIEKLTLPKRVRLALEALGPTFIKFGQILSTRPDLIPREFVDELSFLQDEVPAFSYEEAAKIISSEFGQNVDELFLTFDQVPVAAASLSQVHKAVLRTGETVAVKIQRPNIKEIIENDLAILYDLAKFVEKRLTKGYLYQPAEIVNVFSQNLRRELDFLGEGRNLDKFNENFKDIPSIHFPKVYWQLTSAKILTMEFIDGVKISKVAADKSLTFDKKTIAMRGADAVLKQIFEDGFFHGDPHPGNIFILPGNEIAFLDCGLVGKLDKANKALIADQLIGVIKNDADKIISTWQEMDIISQDSDLKGIKARLESFLDKYVNMPLKSLKIGEIFEEFLDIITCCQVRVPTDFVLLSKAMVTIESIGRQLDGDFNLVEHARPFAEKLLQKKLEPKEILARSQILAGNYLKLAESFPDEWRWLLRTLRRGELSFHISHKNLEKLSMEIDQASNRLSFSLIIAALIVGSSFIMNTSRGPFILGYPVLGVAGYIIAGVFGIGLIISIIRRGRF